MKSDYNGLAEQSEMNQSVDENFNILFNIALSNWCTGGRAGHIDYSTQSQIVQHGQQSTVLHPARKVQLPVPAAPGVDINSLTSVLLLQTLTKSGLLSSTTSESLPHSGAANVPAPSPVTPTHTCAAAEPSASPPLLSPSQLSRFLRYAEAKLDVHNTTIYK
jgi:hypothetical protein